MLQNLDAEEVKLLKLYWLHIQSQSLEDFFSRARALHNGAITPVAAQHVLTHVAILNACLEKRPDFDIENNRLDGLERINEQTVETSSNDNTLRGVDLANDYLLGRNRFMSLIREHVPDKMREVAAFMGKQLQWRRSATMRVTVKKTVTVK